MLIVIGIALAAFSVSEPVTSLNDLPGALWTPILSQDPANPSKLSPASQPYNSTLWGYGPMPIGALFALNIVTSGPVRVTVASVTSQQTLEVIFNEVETRFFEDVNASGGTYQVQIMNEGTNSVEILEGSNVIAQQRITTHETVFPYVSWGILAAVLGVALVVVGFAAKSKRRSIKR